MRKFAVLALAMAVSGCAITQRNRAVQLVVASDAVADEVGTGYKTLVDIKVAECDKIHDPTTSKKSEYIDCLGVASSENGEKLKKIVEALVAIQLSIKIALECETNPLKLPEEFREQCIDGKKADWKQLADSLSNAWEDLRPFIEAIRGSK